MPPKSINLALAAPAAGGTLATPNLIDTPAEFPEELCVLHASKWCHACTGNAEGGSLNGSGPQPHQAVVTVLFGTEYGFSKEIAQKLAAKLNESHDFWQALPPAQPCIASLLPHR